MHQLFGVSQGVILKPPRQKTIASRISFSCHDNKLLIVYNIVYCVNNHPKKISANRKGWIKCLKLPITNYILVILLYYYRKLTNIN